jgi:hypothetical protein
LEELCERLAGTVEPQLDGIGTQTEYGGSVSRVHLFDIAQEQDGAMSLRQPVDGLAYLHAHFTSNQQQVDRARRVG